MIQWWNSLPIHVTDAIWTISVGATCAIACALLGCYLVLRRISLIGDAISHAVLPGLVLAFILTGTRNPVPMMLGAMALGVLTAVLTEALHRVGRVPTDASMGVVFTSLFALGVILITVYASQIDLDPGCVLYGLIEFTVFDTIGFGELEVPRAFLATGATLGLVLAFITIFWKELKICSFDPMLASSMGISAALVHYMLMAMVAMTTVSSFEAVGSILVVAMLIAPGATAHLLTDRLGRMMRIAAGAALSSAILGYLGGVWLNTSVAGMIAVVSGIQFALAAMFSPRYGVIGKAVHNLRMGLQIVREDALGILWRLREREGRASISRPELERLLGAGWMTRLAMRGLQSSRLITASAAGDLALSGAGREEARRLVRAHRLWETFLSSELERSPQNVDESAHRIEHVLDSDLADRLDHRLSHPATDPHGSPIPRDDADDSLAKETPAR